MFETPAALGHGSSSGSSNGSKAGIGSSGVGTPQPKPSCQPPAPGAQEAAQGQVPGSNTRPGSQGAHLRTRSWAEAMGVRVSRPSCGGRDQ